MRQAATYPLPMMPLDVRLMNVAARMVYVLLVLAVLAGALLWLVRSPGFTLRGIALDGDLSRNSVHTVRANAMPLLTGNFFTVDLDRARSAFESVPWVRRAEVRRIWPDRLAVRIEEHRPAALWLGLDGSERLVNTFGEVFDANLGDVDEEALPLLSGPEGRSGQMLATFERLRPAFAAQSMTIEALQLSGRGSWRVRLEGGAVIELGRGGTEEVFGRAERFLRTLPELTRRFGRPLVAADLRHPDGYAVRLLGLATLPAAAPGARQH